MIERTRADVTEAKLLRPPTRPGIVSRTALKRRLTESAGVSVIAVVAPPGYGKTTLLSDWADHDPRPFAWVSVDDGDADPVVFLAHIAAAVDRVDPLPPEVFEAISSPGASSSGRAIRRLGDALAVMKRPFVLVLDDLDRSSDHLCMDAVVTFARHLPEGAVIAIAARTAPNVGLPRFRAEGRLLEVGVDDLALNPAEAHQLLRDAGMNATRAEAEEITNATEGWPVGLYLAALSRQEQGRSGLAPIRFTGEDRFVVDYVRAEVLGPLSRQRHRFLTRTSVLERLSGPLCDAVLERPGSARALEAIEGGNLLLVPLDHQREWYRYHHLFRDVLRSELHRQEPGLVPELHRRAADWFESLGILDEALKHAFAAGDLDRSAELLQRQAPSAYRFGRIATIKVWLDRLEGEATRNAGLAIAGAYFFALTGDPMAADRWLDAAQQTEPSGPSALGTASLRSLLALTRATMTRDGPAAMRREAELAVGEEPPASPFRPAALFFLGLAMLLEGDIDRADGAFAEAIEVGEPKAAFPSVTASLAERSLIASAGRERARAEAFADRALEIVRAANMQEHVTTGPVYAASARVALRAGDEERARGHLTAAHRLRPILTYTFPTIAVQTRLELVRVHVGLSDVAGARMLLGEVDDILAHRPDLGVLTERARELRAHVGAIRTAGAPGPTTLTAAELRVLNLLPTYMSFREIGDHLFVSANTVRSQATSIYRKLGVSTRSEAVQRARATGLLEE